LLHNTHEFFFCVSLLICREVNWRFSQKPRRC
jgi:hypothetical protein